ncbi:MAG: efflux RND transporter periplasmic adaptor subunit [Xanthobacteraceae bacterium]
MKASRITAFGLVVGAALWIASGHFLPHESAESRAAIRTVEGEAKKLFRVAVSETYVVPHSRKLVLSGRTEADKRVVINSRANGEVKEVRVKRGSVVKAGDIIAVLSDEAREAQVVQAQSLVTQRRTELEAKRGLLASGAIPRLEGVNLEAQLRIAEANLALALAERERGIVRAPWSGVIVDLAVEVGQASFSFSGRDIASLLAFDPMLAVVEVSERKLAGTKVGQHAAVRLVTGETVSGRIRFVSKTASATTRTYRVEVELPNVDGAIPDGITAEVSIPLAQVAATRVPRSALTYSSAGELGVRNVNDDNVVGFSRVSVLEDEQTYMWVSGLVDRTRVIVQGQDFVREGQKVDAVPAVELTATAR